MIGRVVVFPFSFSEGMGEIGSTNLTTVGVQWS